MVPFVGRVYHLVKIVVGKLSLCGVVDVGSCVSEVVGCPVCRIDHVGLFEEVVCGGVKCLCPNVFGVCVVEMEPQPVLGPLSDDWAKCVMFKRVFLVLAPEGAVARGLFPKSPASAPPPEYGVPACEPDPGGHMFHDVFEVVDASAGVNPWPAEEVPFAQVLPKLFLHVKGGKFP